MKKSYVVYIVLSLLILIPLVVASVRYFMPVPNDISYQSEEYQTDDVNFLYDITCLTRMVKVSPNKQLWIKCINDR